MYVPTVKKSTLISRRGYSGLSGFTDTVGDILGGAINFFGKQQQAIGAAQASQQLAQQQLAMQNQGPDTTTLLIGAAAIGGIAYLFLRKKKAA